MKYRLILVFIIMTQYSKAQQSSNHWSDHLYFEGLYTDLRSTHSTHFRGAAVEIGKEISPLFSWAAAWNIRDVHIMMIMDMIFTTLILFQCMSMRNLNS